MFYEKLHWLLFVFFLVLTACSFQDYEPERPVSVPKEAMWVGGIDGGAWIFLKKKDGYPDYIYYAEIYGDQFGDPWYIGRLEVVPHTQPDVPLNNPGAYGVWDGDNLLLEDGRSMRTIDKFDPFQEK